MRISELISEEAVEDEQEGDLFEVPINEDASKRGGVDYEVFYVWEPVHSDPVAKTYLTEVKGNTNLKLTGKYVYRYDPPRAASTGEGQTPMGDHHLFSGKQEIAAWNDAGKARHGFPSGTKIPKKAYRQLKDLIGDANLPPNGVLEQLHAAVTKKQFLVEVPI